VITPNETPHGRLITFTVPNGDSSLSKCSLTFDLKAKTCPFSATVCFLAGRITYGDKVQNYIDSKSFVYIVFV
jgi:hypothetical protein